MSAQQLIYNGSPWKRLVAAVIVAAVLCFSTNAHAQDSPWGEGKSDPSDLVISLATFSPGDDIPSWFGHAGLIVEDRHHNESRLYNYGMFHFDGAMLVRFAMGRLWFWVAPTPVAGTYRLYEQLDRDIHVIELNLPESRRAEVAELLAENVRPENRDYLYHHYDDNCATRLRDVIDEAVGGQFAEKYKNEPARLTLREHTRRHSAHNPPMDWLLMYMMNGSIDRDFTSWDEMFLPGELEHRVLDFEWVDDDGEVRPLALREHEVYRAKDREPPPTDPPVHWPWWLLTGVGVALVGLLTAAVARRRPGTMARIGYGLYHLIVGLLMGIPGLALGVMSVVTDHSVTYWNLNLFYASPLTMVVPVLAFLVMRGSTRARRRLVLWWSLLAGVAAVGVVVNLIGFFVPVLYQDTSMPVALLLPLIAGSTLSAWLVDGALVRSTRHPEPEEG